MSDDASVSSGVTGVGDSKPRRVHFEHLETLRAFLALPVNRGRVLTVTEIAHGFGKSRTWVYKYLGEATVAQEWLTLNQDAPVDAKVHYEAVLKDRLGAIDPPTTITVPSYKKGDPHKFFVPKDKVREKVSVLTGSTDSGIPKPKITTSVTETVMVTATKHEATIERIRNAYVLAPLGDTPNVHEIMTEFALLDKHGRATTSLDENEVRKAMVEEGWRDQRTRQLYNTFDVIPDELRLSASVKNFEMHKMLFQQARYLNRMNSEYIRHGKVMAADGKTPLDYRPDFGTMASLAEVMRRMVDGTGNVNILIGQIQQNNHRGLGAGIGSGPGGADASTATRRYLSMLSTLDAGDLEGEIAKLERMRSLVVDSDDMPPMDGDVIDAESVSDVTPGGDGDSDTGIK